MPSSRRDSPQVGQQKTKPSYSTYGLPTRPAYAAISINARLQLDKPVCTPQGNTTPFFLTCPQHPITKDHVRKHVLSSRPCPPCLSIVVRGWKTTKRSPGPPQHDMTSGHRPCTPHVGNRILPTPLATGGETDGEEDGQI